VEFAGIFNGLGSNTYLAYRGSQILRGFDQSMSQHLSSEIQKKGIDLKLNSNVLQIELDQNNKKIVTLSDGSKLQVDCIMYATGRTPNTKGLNLQKVGVSLGDKGQILVAQNSQTNIDNIYAVGDVTDRIALTPVATMEGHAFADSLFGSKSRLPDHENVPSAVFSQPPLASVGLSEEEAREKYQKVDTYSSEFKILKHTLTNNKERTLMKLVVDAESDRVVGAHMVGADAAEIMQGIAIAIKAGAKKADFDATVGIHPSSAEEFCTMRSKD
jgi:glutathione reductase (NADPH)